MMRFLYTVVCQLVLIVAPIAGLIALVVYLAKAFGLFFA